MTLLHICITSLITANNLISIKNSSDKHITVFLSPDWQYIRRTVVRREPARIRADSAGVRQQFAADFF